MLHAYTRRSAAVAKAEQAWSGRTILACGLAALGVLGLAAATIDWSEGLDMALGQLAGLVFPLALLAGLVWAAAAGSGRKR